MSDAIAPVIIAGHSHIVALGVRRKVEGELYQQIKLSNGSEKFIGLSGNLPRDPAYWNELLRLLPDRKIALLWQGNQHMVRFMFAKNPKIDFVLSDQPELPLEDSHVVVPELALQQIYRKSLNELSALLARLPPGSNKNLALIGSPPPKDDDAYCRKFFEKEPAFSRIATHLGLSLETIDLTAPLIRYKHWALLQKVMKQIADEFSVPFVPAPRSAQNGPGFLKRELWCEDVTHANRAYGELVLDAISGWFDSQHNKQ